ncbi:MAG: M24 family metallopeptidase [Fidelibacterota bacterium]
MIYPDNDKPIQAIRKKRVNEILPKLMNELGISMWLVFTREGSRDPVGMDIGAERVVARGAFIFSLKSGEFSKVAIVASYDATPVAESGIYDEIITYKDEGIGPHLKETVKKLNPRRIGLNFSRDIPMADGLSYGMRKYLEEILGLRYAKRFVSAEDLVVSFRSRKLDEEIKIIEKAVSLTQKIINETLSSRHIKAGETTEKHLSKILKRKTREAGAEVSFASITTGPTRGHSEPTDRVIERGDLIRVDFGIKYKGYFTDIQRTAYMLKHDENSPSKFIQKMWDINLKANRLAVSAMKPGVRGIDVDAKARFVLKRSGFNEYPHSSGHPIGYSVHDAGPILGPDWKERYGKSVFFKLQEGQVFAVEPIVYAYYPETDEEINIGLEENVVVDSTGARYLGKPQMELILIR